VLGLNSYLEGAQKPTSPREAQRIARVEFRDGFKEAGFPTERILCHDKNIPAVGSAPEKDE
jgi:hypothetical protein